MQLHKVVFLVLSVTFCLFVSVWNISGTVERICAKVTRKMCLVPHSDEFEYQGQRSKVKVTRDKFPPHWKCTVTCSLQITSCSSRWDHSITAGLIGVHNAAACSLCLVKAKFHYARWFGAGSKLVADRFEAKFHYAIWVKAGRRQVRSWSALSVTSFEPASIMEFGFKTSLARFFSERELTFTFAICYHPSICRLLVPLVHPT